MRIIPRATFFRAARPSSRDAGFRSLARRHWNARRELTGLALLVLAAACGDGPNAPESLGPQDPGKVVARVMCIGNTQTRQVACTSVDSGSIVASLTPSSRGARADIILGGQNTFVTLTSSDVVYSSDVFSFNTTVTNLIGQALGTTDGTTVAPTGVRVFFQSAPVVTGGTGAIDFDDPGGGSLVDGVGTFTASNQAYYQYSELIAPTQTSSARQWRIHVPSTVTTFSFTVLVSAPVQFPDGWIDVAPAIATIRVAGTQALTATVRDLVGRTLTGETVTWATSSEATATVSSAGLVTGVADGTATISATSGTRPGSATITVTSPAGSATTITGAPATLQVGDTTVITVQAKNAAGVAMTDGGDAVVLASSIGTLGAVTDNDDGTYTATLTSTTAGSAAITGTINGQTIGHPGAVTFTPGAVASIAINAGDVQTASSGAAVSIAPSVIVKDSSNNVISGVTVTFSVVGGGGSVTAGTATTDASGIATVGSWTLGSGGSGCSAAAISSCSRNALQAAATGGSNPTVDFKAYIPPIVPTATYQAVGNTTLTIAVAKGVLAGAFSINGDGPNGTGAPVAVTTPTPTGSNSGTVTIALNGSFTYLSSPAYVSSGAGTENFTFGVTDALATTNASGTLQVNVPERVWYVRPGYGGTSTGSDAQPFKDFSTTAGQGVESSAPAGDTILVESGSGTANGGTLKNTQFVYGQGASVARTFTTGSSSTYRNGDTTLTLLAPGSTPSLGALVLANSNGLRGVTLTGAGGAVALTGTNFGTLNLSETFITTNGGALSLTTGTLAGSLASMTSAGGTNNVLLSGVSTSGTFSFGGGSLLGATGDAFRISGGSGIFTYSGPIANANTLAVNISGMTGGSVTLSGNINTTAAPGAGIAIGSNTGGSITLNGSQIGISSGAATGIAMTGNGAPVTVSLTPGTMRIATTTGAGLNATSNGTLTVTGANNTITTTTGTPIHVSDVTIGAAGITLRSVTTNGAANGIHLSNTGTVGGVTVTGDGSTAASGGTIRNIVGSDGASAGNAVYLSNTSNVSLSWLAINNTANSAIFGTGVRSLLVDHTNITGTIGTKPSSGAPRESPIHLENTSGSVRVQNSRLDGGAWDGFLLDNSAGTAPAIDSLVLANDTVSTMQGSLVDAYANTGLQVILSDGRADVRIRNNVVTYWWGNGIQVAVGGSATATARITGNSVRQTSGALAGAGGIWVSGGSLSYNISNNNVQGTNGTAISADRQAAASNFNGTIDGNIIGTSGVANSGSGTGIGIFASHTGTGTTTVRISNNTLRQINGSANGAITTLIGDDVGGGGSGFFNATIVGNNIAESGTTTNSAQHGILVTNGRVGGDSDVGCYDIGGAGGLANTITNFNTATGGTATNRIRINERFVTTAHFPGYAGANNDNNALGAYLLGRNVASNFAIANNVSAGGTGFTNTTPPGSACAQPSM